ncbi:MAG: fibronectin type III domain-containing protein, partial [Actinobacteria bacterium]|nr:fibronectin type III domain-containing protein [Actinomycetota bacterium]
ILDNLKIKCWGFGSYGRLGYENTTTRGDGSNEMGDNLPFVALGFTTGVRTAIGRPNAPTSVQATPSSTTVTLSWTAPSDSGGSAITGYRIDRSTDGRNWITATANSGTTTTTANITSLSAATTHYFRVAGINAVGVGAGSTTKVVSTSAGTPSGLVTLTPTRIINTRPTGKIGNRTGTADPMTFNVYNKGGLPASGIGAVLLNVTVVDPEVGDEGGYLTVYPCASGRPDASNLNFVTGQIIPNTVIAPVDPSGNICFYSYGKTHVLADVSGYFPTGSSLTTLTPTRIINTRPTGKIGDRLGTADPMTFNVYGKGGLPSSGISAVLLNVTVVDPEVGDEGGFLTVYPCASGRPDASNLNFVSRQIIPNTVIAPVDPSGNICFYSYGKTHVLADVSGYFPS